MPAGWTHERSRLGHQKHFAPGPPFKPSQEKGDKMLITLPDGSRKEIAGNEERIENILTQLCINPEEVIVSRNGKIVPEEEMAGLNDELKIVRFVHGG
jgi:sulfur carrier protein ThiS